MSEEALFVNFQEVFVNSMKKTIIQPLCYKNRMSHRIQKSSQIISTKIHDTVPEKYDVLRSVVFAS